MSPQKNTISVTWYKSFLLETLEHAKSADGQKLIPYFEERIRILSNSDLVYLLVKENSSDENKYIIPSQNRMLKPCVDEGVFGEMLKKQQPIFIKDCEQSLLFNNNCDNLAGKAIKDLFLIPIYINGDKEEYPPYLCWGAALEDSDKEISQKNILFILKFLESLKSHLANINSSIQSPEQYYINQIEDLIKQQERSNLYFHNIIHDIRTPMNALMGFLELLAHNEEDETKSSYIASAIKSAEQMVRLINDALDIAKIEKGELPIEKHAFNPTTELMESIRIFYEAAKKKSIMLSTYFDPSIPEKIVSDQYRIKQVLSNLLSNAIKFTPKHGSVCIEVLYTPENDTLKVSVTDTGIGIAESEKKYVFTPFRQANAGIQKEYGGTGLGLSVSQQIVSLLGGKLEFESTEGVGTTFSMTIPAHTPEGTDSFIRIARIPAGLSVHLHRWKDRSDPRAKVVTKYLDFIEAGYTPSSTGFDNLNKHDLLIIDKDYYDMEESERIQLFLDQGKRVLFLEDVFDTDSKWYKGEIRKVTLPIFSKDFYEALGVLEDVEEQQNPHHYTTRSYKGKRVVIVDDNKINLRVMEQILKSFDLEIAMFEDGLSTLEYLRDHHADFLIIDENMPEMSGSEVIGKIRNGETKNTKIPIVSLTGDVYHKEEILQSGADAIILKPVKINEISKILAQYLSQ